MMSKEEKQKVLEELKQEITENIMKYLPEQFQSGKLHFKKVIKIDRELYGFSILREEKSVTPICYLDNYLDEFVKNPKETVKRIATQYAAADKNSGEIIAVAAEFKKENVYVELIKKPTDESFLNGIPHVEVLDMIGVFRCMVRATDEGRGSILIKEEHLDYLKINSTEELFDLAKTNTLKLMPLIVKPMRQVLIDMGMDESLLPITEDDPMYCITNRMKQNGANAIFFPDLFKELAEELESDLMILPSSVHELLAVPKTSDTELDMLRDMVRDVNNTQVAEDEVLSYNVYQYDRETNSIHIAA